MSSTVSGHSRRVLDRSDCCATNGASKARYDLAVIGAGSAGFSAAITASEQGAKVALIGHGAIGGTCVNVGCIPSKTMIRAAEALHGARAAGRFPGLAGEAQITDWSRLVAAKDDLIAMLRQAKYVDLLREYDGVAYLQGAARLDGTGILVKGNAVCTDKIVIATGASPSVPAIPGLSSVPYLTSTTALELTELPRSVLVIGGGYIGCELAQMLARTGVAVTLVTRSHLLPDAEPEVRHVLGDSFRADGMTVRTGVSYRQIERTARGIALTIHVGGETEVLVAEQVLVTTGRTPNTTGLALNEAGIELTPRGAIVVDDRMRTTRPGVYAAGDVTGRDQFVYMAAHGAKLAALNALNGDGLVYENNTMPWVVFTDPQLAGVGLTELAAQAQGLVTKSSLVTLDQVPRAVAARDTRGLIKLVADARTDRLLGAQILAPEGADSIQTVVLALKHRMTTMALGDVIFPYLTTVEGVRLAAQAFRRDIKKLSCCAG